ncbi:MAG TPA: hypothetical protein PKO06_01855 [Candidatus Ozemobacteraceae bacterium]|nr:hypothetical protein [Candidatus Ozemobacteraceae bacterium]
MIEYSPLLPIQELDLAIDELDRKVAQLQEKFEKLAVEIKKEEEALAAKESLFKKITLRRSQAELENDHLADRIRSAELKLQTPGVPPVAYQSLEKEIAENREKASVLETRILEDMEKSEQLAREIEKARKVATGRQQQLDEFKVKIKTQKQGLLAEKETQVTKRRQATLGLAANLLETYEDVRQRTKGRVIWEAETPGCPSCGISLPAHVVRQLSQNLQKAGPCPACGAYMRWTGLVDAA